MTRPAAIAIAAGAALGAGLRWSVVDAVGGVSGFPWPVFALNVAGSLVLGVALARAHAAGTTIWWRDAVGIGFCGGLTTFSTFAVESAGLVRDGHPGLAVTYVATSVLAALAAIITGAALSGGVAAIDDPLEAEP